MTAHSLTSRQDAAATEVDYTGRHRATSRAVSSRATALSLAALTAAGLGVAGTGSASAAPAALPTSPIGSAAALGSSEQQLTRDVLNARDGLQQQAQLLPGQLRDAASAGIDNAVNAIAPGALAAREAAARPAPAPAPAPEPAPRANPCPASARVCVDLAANRTWLQDNGRTVYGPVVMSHGKPGMETPRGRFVVTRKVRDEISREFGNAPMPYAVYFTNNGHAFHQGSTNTQSAGCVRLNGPDAQRYFDSLNVGDEVFIF